MSNMLKPEMPKPAPVTRMPDDQDPALQRARRARTEELLATSTAERARKMSQNTIAGSPGASSPAATTPFIAGKLGS